MIVGCMGSPGRPRIPESKLMHRRPVDLSLDEWVCDFFNALERMQASGVAIDSLGEPQAACGDEIRFREYIYSLLQCCARANISVKCPIYSESPAYPNAVSPTYPTT
jgi:hypothetical protein